MLPLKPFPENRQGVWVFWAGVARSPCLASHHKPFSAPSASLAACQASVCFEHRDGSTAYPSPGARSAWPAAAATANSPPPATDPGLHTLVLPTPAGQTPTPSQGLGHVPTPRGHLPNFPNPTAVPPGSDSITPLPLSEHRAVLSPSPCGWRRA